MKAAAFDYVRPATVSEALSLLAQNEDARIIAGGQTLVPMMAMRLARPSALIDIAHIPGLQGISEAGDTLVIGAMTRQVQAEKSALVKSRMPLLAAALPWVGHAPTRNRGTIGGSVANADPAAEIPLVLVTLEGSLRWQTEAGEAGCAARDFFAGPMTTGLPAVALLTKAIFPVWRGEGIGVGFHEASARRSDFAYVSAAAQVQIAADGTCIRCAIGIGGATPFPVRMPASDSLAGSALNEGDIRAVIEADIAALDVMTDSHATPAYRRRVATALVLRAISDARTAALIQSDRA